MLDPRQFVDLLSEYGFSFYSGVPDSLLKELCSCIIERYDPQDNIITANEGAAVALASGYHLATGKAGVVYMQNSGTGNAVNPLLSLADRDVYSIPMLLLIGWRGEPGVHDEPQHITQGRVQEELLKSIELPYEILSGDIGAAGEQVERLVKKMGETSAPVALLVRKDTFSTYTGTVKKAGPADLEMNREEALEIILDILSDDDRIVSTTGKASREIFELREARGEGHERDFLTVGSMGHTSMIAYGIARSIPDGGDGKTICIDGDGAAIMHMGSMALIAQRSPKQFIHIIMNNGAHDSVGGQPTIGFDISLAEIARAMGYADTRTATTRKELQDALTASDSADGPVLIEVRIKKGARSDLGRPTSTPQENKKLFMDKVMSRQTEIYGPGVLSRLGDLLRSAHAGKVIVFHGKSSFRQSGGEQAVKALGPDIELSFVSDIEENPDIESITRSAEQYRSFAPDAVVAVGGGSVIDTAKAVIALSGGNSEDEVLSNTFRLPKKRPLFIAVPTTAGSGSEATHFAVIYKQLKKYSVTHQKLRPDIALLDPEATFSCPEHVTLAAGVDAVCQGIESFWSRNANDESRVYSLEALSHLLPSILKAADNLHDSEARGDMLQGAHFAGKAINITKTTAGHAMSYTLTKNYGIPHGLAVMSVMEQLVPLMEEKYGYAAEALDAVFTQTGWGDGLMSGFAQLCAEVKKRVKVQISVSDAAAEIEKLSGQVNIERLRDHPVELEAEDIRRIYEKILG